MDSASTSGEQLPPSVTATLVEPVADFWRRRERQHVRDWYAGLRIKKFPEDLRVLEHLMWSARTQVVVELGTHLGGSTLWFRDRLLLQARYGRTSGPVRVISVDLDQHRAHGLLRQADPRYEEDIVLIEGDVMDPELSVQVRRHVPAGASCLVVEDTAHIYDTTFAALQNFASLVGPAGYFLVEDGIVDVEELRPPRMPGGVRPAITDWLATPQGSDFRLRRDLELYGITSHVGGWLQRRPADEQG